MPKVTLHQEKRPTKKAPNRQKWILRWFDRSGKRCGETIGEVGKMGRRDAEALRRAKQGGMHHGVVKVDKPKKLSLGDFVELDQANMKADVKPATLTEYRLAGKHAITVLGKGRLLSSIAWKEVTQIKQHLIEQGRSVATIRKTMSTLRAMFNRALKQGFVSSNPFAMQRLPKVQSRQMRIFSRDEVACMIESTSNLWWKVFIDLGVSTGLRRAELLNLMWRDIGFKEKTIIVAAKRAGQFMVGEEAYPILEWSSKSHQSRTVPIPDSVIVRLRRLQMKSGGSLYVFLSLKRLKQIARHLIDGRIPAKFSVINNLNREFTKIQRKARALMAKRRGVALENVDWPIGCVHDLRRTYGTWMARVVPMHELKVFMGHQSISTTAVFYLAVSEGSAERVREALAAAMQG